MLHGIRKANLSSEFFIIDQKALLKKFVLGGQVILITRRKTRLLNCVCVCVTVAIWLWNGVWPRKYFVKFFFVLF